MEPNSSEGVFGIARLELPNTNVRPLRDLPERCVSSIDETAQVALVIKLMAMHARNEIQQGILDHVSTIMDVLDQQP